MMYTSERDWKFFFIMVIIVNTVFGSLFFIFRGNPDLNDNCDNQEFLNWSLVAAFSCFLMALLALLIIFLVQCGQKFFLNFLEYSFYGCIIYSMICVMGLNSSLDDKCGKLQVLALVFLIFTYVMYGVIFFVLCITLCIFSGLSVITNNTILNQNQNLQQQIQQQQQQQPPQDLQQQPLNNPINIQFNYQALDQQAQL